MTFCVSENRRAALSFSETLQAIGVLEFSKQTKLIKKGYITGEYDMIMVTI